MKTAVAIVGLVGAIAFANLAFAQGNSVPGDTRYDQISQNPNPDAQCGTGAGSGAFGYLGKDLNPSDPTLFGNDGKPGVNGKTRTGPNNSSVCGQVPN